MQGMSSVQIDRILQKNPVTKKIYMGCFPSNTLPKCQRYPCAMVVNFDEVGEPGTHWVALFIPNEHRVKYFDSFGDTAIPNIQEYLKKHGFLLVTRQIADVQKIGSSVCGYYAIFFIYMSALRVPYVNIQRILLRSKNPDRFVVNYVRSRIM